MSAPNLDQLTGIRTGKGTFYPQYRGAAERLERVLQALDTISRALVRTVEGPETLVRSVVAAAAEHLAADWVLFALADGALPEAHPRDLVLGPDGRQRTAPGALPEPVARHLAHARAGSLVAHELAGAGTHPRPAHAPDGAHHVHVPVELDGAVIGAFVAWTPHEREVDATDVSVLRILAGQTAVALQNSALYTHGQHLLVSSHIAFEQARAHADELAARNAELEAAQRQLDLAHRRALIDAERHRIARELHDGVTQCVLSAGMQIEVCRADPAAPDLQQRLGVARELARSAVDQLRSAIYALNHDGVGPGAGGDEDPDATRSLPEVLAQLTAVHLPDELQVSLRVEGTPTETGTGTDHALLRIAGEALFNTAVHAHATRAVVRLVYTADELVLSVSDDGNGDPAVLRTILGLAGERDLDGHHRGLANMAARAAELGGSLRVRRARLGGVQVTARVPVRAVAVLS